MSLLDQTRFDCGVRKSMKTIWTGYDPTRHVKPTSRFAFEETCREGIVDINNDMYIGTWIYPEDSTFAYA